MMATKSKTLEWAYDVDINNITRRDLKRAYKLDLDGCSASTCKRNCAQKPKCLFLMGEKKWLEKDADYWEANQKVDVTWRHNQDFCGLKNLGATCYVNSLLQVLFHNQFLRRAIYLWKPELDSKENNLWLQSQNKSNQLSNGRRNSTNSYEPKSPIGQLQWVFARLQFGYCKYVDPTPFVKSLDLDVSQQQDAQEFCKLFLNLLEEDLSSQRSPLVQSVVQDEYLGEYNYETQCLKCNNVIRSPSKFYELSLNIEGMTNIKECLQQYVTAEVLEESNAYFCSVCNEKQTATRAIRLTRLPSTLNLQLMRFIFDRNKGTRKKLNSVIAFPEILDMSELLSDPGPERTGNETKPSDAMYQLTAVLVHFGNSAHQGHYVAHIKDPKSGFWYKFNDERVEKIESGKLNKIDESSPDCEIIDELSTLAGVGDNGHASSEVSEKSKAKEDSEDKDKESGKGKKRGPKPGKKAPTSKKSAKDPPGTLSSKNAYMLVYSKCSRDQTPVDIDWNALLPETLASRIAVEKEGFEKWSKEYIETQEWLVSKYQQKQEEVKKFFGMNRDVEDGAKKIISIDCDDEEDEHEFVSKDWIGSWLRSTPEQLVPPIDNRCLLCVHGKLDINRISDFKCVSSKSAKFLRDLYLSDSELTEKNSLCVECVQGKVKYVQLRAQIAEDAKKITELSKDVPQIGKANYWVGVKCFKNWRSFAMTEDEDGDTSNEVFNDEIVCKHGGLILETSGRKVVTGELWSILRNYFPTCPEFRSTHEVCPECENEKKAKNDELSAATEKALEEKSLLLDLYSMKKRPKLSVDIEDMTQEEEDIVEVTSSGDIVPAGDQPMDSSRGRSSRESGRTSTGKDSMKKWREKIFIVSALFYKEWKLFIENAAKNEAPKGIVNEHLLCSKHGNLLYPLDGLDSLVNDKLILVSEGEWEILSQMYPADETIYVRRNPRNGKSVGNESITFTSHPPHCEECYKELQDAERNERLDYARAKIFIRKIQPETNTVEDMDTDDTSRDADVVMVSSRNSSRLHRSSAASASGDRNQNNKENNGHETELSGYAFYSKLGGSVGSGGSYSPPMRRSTRLRRGPDQKEIIVSSDDTLKSLKVKVMDMFKIATFDQNLSLNGILLCDNEKTLAQLSVFPDSVIELRVDVPDPNAVEDPKEETGPETGFKGTRLIR